jgi:hypothetical protein
MIPFITTRTEPSALACGWALASVTLPCVAHRVWPTPQVEVEPPLAPAASRSRSRFPTARTASTTPADGSSSANPDESYPRYSRRSRPVSMSSRHGRPPT